MNVHNFNLYTSQRSGVDSLGNIPAIAYTFWVSIKGSYMLTNITESESLYILSFIFPFYSEKILEANKKNPLNLLLKKNQQNNSNKSLSSSSYFLPEP